MPTRLVTSGRRWSNHARLTAAAGARAGLEVHLVLSGPPADPPNPGVVLDELLGATVHQAATDDRAERAALLERVVADLRAAGRRVVIVVGVGGSGVTGAIGQVLAGLELADQVARRAGSCRTTWSCRRRPAAPRPGCWSGCARPACRRVVHGIAVTPPEELAAGDRGARRRARRGGRSGARRTRPRSTSTPGQLGDGYGSPTEAAAEATRLLARTEGILVDPIYTAKALAGLIERVRSGALDGHRVVFWHAGGTPGLFEPLAGPEG